MSGVAPLLAVALSVRPAFDASVGVGGVYDTNLAHAPASASTEDTAGVQGWAAAGVRRPLETRAYAYAGLRYDGLAYPDLPDLSSNAFGADAALGLDVARRTTVSLLPSASVIWYGDDARTSRTVRIGASIRTRPWDRLSLRAGYARSYRDANESVYSADADRIALGAEGRIARGVYLRAGWASQWGDEVFYLPATGTSDMRTGMRRTGTFGPLLEVVRASALTRSASVGIEVALWGGLHGDLAFGSSWVDADPGEYTAHAFAAAIGWRR
jgi:hypothetical protein